MLGISNYEVGADYKFQFRIHLNPSGEIGGPTKTCDPGYEKVSSHSRSRDVYFYFIFKVAGAFSALAPAPVHYLWKMEKLSLYPFQGYFQVPEPTLKLGSAATKTAGAVYFTRLPTCTSYKRGGQCQLHEQSNLDTLLCITAKHFSKGSGQKVFCIPLSCGYVYSIQAICSPSLWWRRPSGRPAPPSSTSCSTWSLYSSTLGTTGKESSFVASLFFARSCNLS